MGLPEGIDPDEEWWNELPEQYKEMRLNYDPSSASIEDTVAVLKEQDSVILNQQQQITAFEQMIALNHDLLDNSSSVLEAQLEQYEKGTDLEAKYKRLMREYKQECETLLAWQKRSWDAERKIGDMLQKMDLIQNGGEEETNQNAMSEDEPIEIDVAESFAEEVKKLRKKKRGLDPGEKGKQDTYGFTSSPNEVYCGKVNLEEGESTKDTSRRSTGKLLGKSTVSPSPMTYGKQHLRPTELEERSEKWARDIKLPPINTPISKTPDQIKCVSTAPTVPVPSAPSDRDSAFSPRCGRYCPPPEISGCRIPLPTGFRRHAQSSGDIFTVSHTTRAGKGQQARRRHTSGISQMPHPLEVPELQTRRFSKYKK